jgi:hypothetical protein
MSNLSTVQFSNKDWNPFVGAANFIDRLTPKDEEKDKNKSESNAKDQQSHTEETTLAKNETPTPANTGAPIPKSYSKKTQVRIQGPINPSTTGAPVPGKKNTATHPITGAKVPRVPVKSKGKKPTAPGTRPKKR